MNRLDLSTAWATAKMRDGLDAIKRGDMPEALAIEIELSASRRFGATFACQIVTDGLIEALANREMECAA